MNGIGERLRAERRRQGRSLADAAAETRVRESYLAAIENDDFAPLGGDVYARGFIRMYARYLSLDTDQILDEFDANHSVGVHASPFPTSQMEDFDVPMGRSRLPVNTPVLAAIGLVSLLVIAFIGLRNSSQATDDAIDPNAPGPSPAEVADDGSGEAPLGDADSSLADTPANPLVDAPSEDPLDGVPILEALSIEVLAIRPIRLHVVQGQPPVTNAQLREGDLRQLSGDRAVIFHVSDAAGVQVKVNGQPLEQLGGDGQAVSVSCIIGNQGCDVREL